MIFTDNLLRKQDKFIIKKNEKMKINNAQITLNRSLNFSASVNSHRFTNCVKSIKFYK